ncbi:MAG: hypothetical protein KJP07_20350 [Desulfatitalea sp.]|nr:hypothetical protein [Desulfatitalea sp.]
MTVMRDKVVKELAGLSVQGDDDGLINAFNVYVNQLPASFWNTFSERLIAATPRERKKEVEEALVRCAYECGYHTGYGIITSDEFKNVVNPMVTEGAKDILRGAYAVFTAWGWAKSGIVKIREGEEMTVRAVDYYESDGPRGEKRAYMIRGVSAAFFELAYAEDYPDGMDTFTCEQTKGIECGDAYGEFVVKRKQNP